VEHSAFLKRTKKNPAYSVRKMTKRANLVLNITPIIALLVTIKYK